MIAPRTELKLQRTLLILALVLVLVTSGTTGIMGSLLTGFVPEAEAPELSLQGWLDGDFQRDADAWFKERFGLRDYYVRIANHLNYVLFSRSYVGRFQIVVGRENQLYEMAYLKNYCQHAAEPNRDYIRETFRRVRLLQDALEERGIAFFLLITPQKASVYPEFIPESLCGPQDSPGREYEVAIEVIREEGIHYVDGFVETMGAIPLHDEIRLFPRGGTHWNWLGAFYTTRALLEMADRLSSREIPGIALESVEIDRSPQLSDKDLADLLNLVYPPLGYEVPHPVIVPQLPPRRDVRILFVGGSFLHVPMDILAKTEIFEHLDHYFYYDKLLTHHETGEFGKPFERSEIDWEADIFSADVVVLESNMIAFYSDHITKFLDDALWHLGVE